MFLGLSLDVQGEFLKGALGLLVTVVETLATLLDTIYDILVRLPIIHELSIVQNALHSVVAILKLVVQLIVTALDLVLGLTSGKGLDLGKVLQEVINSLVELIQAVLGVVADLELGVIIETVVTVLNIVVSLPGLAGILGGLTSGNAQILGI